MLLEAGTERPRLDFADFLAAGRMSTFTCQAWYILAYTMTTAKLFKNGRSQAVRLPKEFRFLGEEVSIRRAGEKVILEPKRRRAWPRGYWKSWKSVPKDFQAPAGLPGGEPRVDLDER
jgi:antitoxin VapB